MKKSTLITTIAMIVVVVVALSTATYAWFTSASTSVVNTSISVTSDAGWLIMGTSTNSVEGTTETIAFNEGTAISMNMLNGMYSPTATINSALSSYTASGEMTNLASFYEATQVGLGNKGTATIVDAASVDPISSGKPSAANYIRVVNTYADTKNLTLTITVVIDHDDTTVQQEAAQKLCLYASIYKQTGASAGTLYVANTAYDTGSLDGSTASKAKAVNTSSVDASTNVENTSFAVGGSTTYVSAATKPLSDGTYVGTAAPIDTDAKDYYQLYIDMGPVDNNMAVNIGLYVWFNGWLIDSTATGANADVYLAFGTTPSRT